MSLELGCLAERKEGVQKRWLFKYFGNGKRLTDESNEEEPSEHPNLTTATLI
jgi:hypothetical protein